MAAVASFAMLRTRFRGSLWAVLGLGKDTRPNSSSLTITTATVTTSR